jgi:anti-sigma factor RsiW
MSGQVLGFVRSGHRMVFDLLPWFVNGTLEQAERVLVEQHLPECAACRRELDWLQQLGSAYVQSELAVDSVGAFARFEPQLESKETRTETNVPPRGWLHGLLTANSPWLKIAVAMQFGVIVALGWALAAREPPQYRTLGATQKSMRAAGSLIVVFEPATRESEVRRILREAGARVVDGPTAANGYVLEVDSRPGLALAALRGEPAVVLAERLQAERVR